MRHLHPHLLRGVLALFTTGRAPHEARVLGVRSGHPRLGGVFE